VDRLLKIPDTEGFVVKSTKTTNDFEARRFAEDLYYQLEGKARRGEPINSPTFRKVFAEWSKVPVTEQVVGTARYVHGNVRRWRYGLSIFRRHHDRQGNGS
jgi:integrase